MEVIHSFGGTCFISNLVFKFVVQVLRFLKFCIEEQLKTGMLLPHKLSTLDYIKICIAFEPVSVAKFSTIPDKLIPCS